MINKKLLREEIRIINIKLDGINSQLRQLCLDLVPTIVDNRKKD